MAEVLTVGDVARGNGLPLWKVRNAVDSLEIDMPRAGLYRLIPRESLPLVIAELRRRGWLPDSVEAAR
jgi:hypothetical protein